MKVERFIFSSDTEFSEEVLTGFMATVESRPVIKNCWDVAVLEFGIDPENPTRLNMTFSPDVDNADILVCALFVVNELSLPHEQLKATCAYFDIY